MTRPRADENGRPLVTRWFIAHTSGRNPELVARHCHPVACDVRNRALLYDADEAEQTLADIPRRRPSNPISHPVDQSGR